MQIVELSHGDMVAFRIAPDAADGQINANRWGLFKVLYPNGTDIVTVAPYANIYNTPPKIGWFTRPRPLVESRFSYQRTARNKVPSVFTILEGAIVDLPDPHVVKSGVRLTPSEREEVKLQKYGTPHSSYMAWPTLSMIVDHEDRAKRDPVAWELDITRRRAADDAKFAAQRTREGERLKGITLGQLASETPFTSWDERADIVPPTYTEAARKRVRTLISALDALGPKPKRADVRRELKACVEWFNDVDGTMGYAIETVEREDIYAALEEICWACKQKPLVHEIENWRDW